MTPFLRLALLLGGSAYALALAIVGLRLGWGIAAGVALVGGSIAAALTLERAPDPAPEASSDVAKGEEGPSARDLGPTGALRIRDRRDVVRDAEAARRRESETA